VVVPHYKFAIFSSYKFVERDPCRGHGFPVITWDEAKRLSNLAERGLDFADVTQFDFDTCATRDRGLRDYGECQEIAIGWCGLRLCRLVFVLRGDDEIRVISFRKATKQEVRRYADS
jgi:uncharacterized DUF497 family protein